VETSLKYERELQQLPALKRQLETLKAGTSLPPSFPPSLHLSSLPPSLPPSGATDTEVTLRELQAAVAEHENKNEKQQQQILAFRLTLPPPLTPSLPPPGATDTELTLRELQAAVAEHENKNEKQQEIQAFRLTLPPSPPSPPPSSRRYRHRTHP